MPVMDLYGHCHHSASNRSGTVRLEGDMRWGVSSTRNFYILGRQSGNRHAYTVCTSFGAGADYRAGGTLGLGGGFGGGERRSFTQSGKVYLLARHWIASLILHRNLETYFLTNHRFCGGWRHLQYRWRTCYPLDRHRCLLAVGTEFHLVCHNLSRRCNRERGLATGVGRGSGGSDECVL